MCATWSIKTFTQFASNRAGNTVTPHFVIVSVLGEVFEDVYWVMNSKHICHRCLPRCIFAKLLHLSLRSTHLAQRCEPNIHLPQPPSLENGFTYKISISMSHFCNSYECLCSFRFPWMLDVDVIHSFGLKSEASPRRARMELNLLKSSKQNEFSWKTLLAIVATLHL